MPCCAKAMAVASTAPIQIGRYRSPSTSLSRTIGCWLGSSTRTPTTLTSERPVSLPSGRPGSSNGSSYRGGVRFSSLPLPPSIEPVGSAPQTGPEPRSDERRVQLDRQCRELPDDLVRVGPRLRVALPDERCHDLLDQPDLPVRRGLEGPQVPRLDAEA